MSKTNEVLQKPDADASGLQTDTLPWERINHPLHLHHTDQPGITLVNHLLAEDNYINWAQSMTMALTIKNKSSFIDGKINRPLHNEDEQYQWDRCDMLVRAWLLEAMTKEIASSVMHCNTARAIWTDLQERFSYTNTVQLYQIEDSIHNCEQGSSTVTTFFTKLKALWDEKESLCSFPPCTCEAAAALKDYLETQRTMKFLMGLNDEFHTVRSTIIGIGPLPGLNKAYAMALRHEKQASNPTSKIATPVESSAFVVKKSGNRSTGEYNKAWSTGRTNQQCGICGFTNHNTDNCKAHLTCTFCGGRGHTRNYCKRRRGPASEQWRDNKNAENGQWRDRNQGKDEKNQTTRRSRINQASSSNVGSPTDASKPLGFSLG